ncbi:hypothetical protein EDB83DRAFT_2314069 [Lactarius deliciosus]|nr:hypothetical protein EDB83DRAFT_2314069 [Lactarius deliciosus]
MQEARPAPIPCITRRPVHAQTGYIRKGGAQALLFPHRHLFAGGHTRACCPPPYPLSTPPRSRRKAAYEGTSFPLSGPLSFPHIPPSLSFAPSPSPVRAPIRTEGRMRAPTTTLSLSSRPLPLHSREGTSPPPFPIRAEGRSTRACCPIRAGRVYTRSRHPQPLPSPSPSASPLPRCPVRAARGHARARGPTLPHSHDRGDRIPPPPLPIWPHRPVCEGTPPPAPPFPLATPCGIHGKTQGQAMPASPRVAQQGRCGLRASAFTAPAPRFRAP